MWCRYGLLLTILFATQEAHGDGAKRASPASTTSAGSKIEEMQRTSYTAIY